MEEQSVVHGTFVIERSFRHTPQQVFDALADPAKKRRWYADGESHDVEEFEMDFRVGGIEKVSYRLKAGTPFPGTSLSTDAHYQDIVPGRRVVMTSAMTFGGRRISASLSTFELLPTEKGTDLIFTEQAAFFEGADGPRMREAGWRHLLERLSKELTG